MSALIPYGVAIASELGAVTALRESRPASCLCARRARLVQAHHCSLPSVSPGPLATHPSPTSSAKARIIIAGFHTRQTVTHGDAPSWATWGAEKVMSALEQVSQLIHIPSQLEHRSSQAARAEYPSRSSTVCLPGWGTSAITLSPPSRASGVARRVRELTSLPCGLILSLDALPKSQYFFVVTRAL